MSEEEVTVSWQDVAERWKAAADEAEAKLWRIRALIRDDHLIEVMGTEYLAVPEVRAILDGVDQ